MREREFRDASLKESARIAMKWGLFGLADLVGSTATLATSPLAGDERLLASDSGADRVITPRQIAAYIGDALGNQYFGTAQSLTASATTYLSGSGIQVPTGERVKNTTYARWKCQMHKTGAGTVANSLLVKWGTNGTTADATLATLAFPIGTAAADEAVFEVFAAFRSIGAGTAAVLVAEARMYHNLQITGWATIPSVVVAAVVSSGFNSDVNLSTLGLAMTVGASYVITMTSMTAEAKNL